MLPFIPNGSCFPLREEFRKSKFILRGNTTRLSIQLLSAAWWPVLVTGGQFCYRSRSLPITGRQTRRREKKKKTETKNRGARNEFPREGGGGRPTNRPPFFGNVNCSAFFFFRPLFPRDTRSVTKRRWTTTLLRLYCHPLAQMVRPSTPSSPASHLYFFHPPLLLLLVAFVSILIVMSKVEYVSAAPDSLWASLQAARPHLAAGAVARFVSISAV